MSESFFADKRAMLRGEHVAEKELKSQGFHLK